KELADAKQEIQRLKDQTVKLQAIALAATQPVVQKPTDAVADAIKHHQIIKGMTIDQMQAAMLYNHQPENVIWDAESNLTEEDDIKVFQWRVGYQSALQRTR